MTTAVSFERRGYEYVPRFAYNSDLVPMVRTVPSYARTWETRTPRCGPSMPAAPGGWPGTCGRSATSPRPGG